jgi:hypothetical protein
MLMQAPGREGDSVAAEVRAKISRVFRNFAMRLFSLNRR